MLELILATCLTSALHAPLGATLSVPVPAPAPLAASLGATTSAPLLGSPSAPGSKQAGPTSKPAPKDIFPAPKVGLTLEVDSDGLGMSMLDLCAAYAEITGQRFSCGVDTGAILKHRRVQLDRSLDLEPEEVQLVFETLMVNADFVVSPALGEPTPIFSVASLQGAGRSNLRATAIYVAEEDSAVLEAHPAVLFTTVVKLPNIDVRQVSNSMRTMITDANTQQMLPAGNSNSMVLVGFGSNLAAMRRMLLMINDAAGASAEDMKAKIEVLDVKNADADDLAKILSATFGANQGPEEKRFQRSPLTILSDQRTNSIVVRGPSAQVTRVKDLAMKLDVAVPSKGKGKK